MSDDDEENKRDLAENLKEVLASITPQEAKVLRERFGIDLKDDPDLKDVGNLYNITQERNIRANR